MENQAPTPALAVLADFSRHLNQRLFKPHRLLPGHHLQTLWAGQIPRNFRGNRHITRRTFLELSDGTRVKTVWTSQTRPAPTLVAVHGMGGSSDSVYMQAFLHKAYRKGWNAVLLNLYDTNLESRRPRLFHSGSSRPLGEIVQRVSEQEGVERIFLVGISMGANILLKMLGEWSGTRPCRVEAAAVISPLCDLTISWHTLEKRSNTVYRIHYVRSLKQIVQRRAAFLAPYVDMNALRGVRTIREFDEVVTAPLGGFRDAFEYYQKASSAPLLGEIQIPTLVIHSEDDPFLPWEPLTRPPVRENPFLLICLTRRGGHVGFVERQRKDIDRAWAENRVIEFFDAFAGEIA